MPGAAVSVQVTPAKHGAAAHSSVSTQPVPVVVPSPDRPAVQVQLCWPGPWWLHTASVSTQLSSLTSHGRTSSHVPDAANRKPVSQAQECELAPVSVHVPVEPHGAVAQSSMSAQVAPSPVNPAGQVAVQSSTKSPEPLLYASMAKYTFCGCDWSLVQVWRDVSGSSVQLMELMPGQSPPHRVSWRLS